jgi:hypothetical protein
VLRFHGSGGFCAVVPLRMSSGDTPCKSCQADRQSLAAFIGEVRSGALLLILKTNVDNVKTSLSRRERLLALGMTHLCEARTGALSKGGAVNAAFDAGYLALLAAVPDEQARAGFDHPNAAMASEGCHLLGVSRSDTQITLRLVEAYYDGTLGTFDVADTLAWAERMRSAVRPP